MRYLNRKYPFVILRIDSIVLISIAISLILYILRPFSFDLYQGNKIIASFGFGFITFLSLLFFNYFIKNKLSAIKKWTILYEILYTLGLILIISLINYIYFSKVLIDIPFNIFALLIVLYYTFLLGLIPSVVLILIKYNWYLSKQLNSLITNEKENENLDLTISNQLSRSNDFKIKLGSFLFAEADKNNVEIYYLVGEELKNKRIRTTISSVYEELNHPNLFRCHRSFIINLSKIESAKGNSNGYQIKLKHCRKSLPVSRKYVDEFKSYVF